MKDARILWSIEHKDDMIIVPRAERLWKPIIESRKLYRFYRFDGFDDSDSYLQSCMFSYRVLSLNSSNKIVRCEISLRRPDEFGTEVALDNKGRVLIHHEVMVNGLITSVDSHYTYVPCHIIDSLIDLDD